MKTYHKEDCKRVFKNYDMTCTRCVELSNGAEARKGWNDDKILYSRLRSEAIHKHYSDHSANNCDYVARNVPCVAFDW